MQNPKDKLKPNNSEENENISKSTEPEYELISRRRVDDDKHECYGTLEERRYKGFTAPATYWIGDKRVTSTGLWERKKYSYIPTKYMDSEAKAFNWKLYGEPFQTAISGIKKILNAFIFGFDNFRREGKGLYIESTAHGSGKTLLACIIANEILKRDNTVSVKYTTVPDYLELMKQKYDLRSERNQEYRKCTLLILDEMGNKKSDWDKDILRNLISYRMSEFRPIIYVGNCPMKELAGYTQMIALIEDASCKVGLPPVAVRHELAEERKNKILQKAIQKQDKETIF